MAKYQIPIDPEPTHFAQVGELAVRWGWIENQTGVLIRELLRIKVATGHMAIGNLGLHPKTQVIASLARFLFVKNTRMRADLVSLAGDIQTFNDFRNDVVHGLWVYYPKGTTDLALLRRKSLKQKVDPHPDKDVIKQLPRRIEELKTIQKEAQRLTRELKALRGRFD